MGCGGCKGGFEPSPVVWVVSLGMACASLPNTCTVQSYSAACGLARMYFLVFEGMSPESRGCWGLKGSGGFGFVFGCLEFFGCLEISLGDWRKAVSHMYGGSERPCIRPPLIFLRGGGPRHLG